MCYQYLFSYNFRKLLKCLLINIILNLNLNQSSNINVINYLFSIHIIYFYDKSIGNLNKLMYLLLIFNKFQIFY